MKMQIKIKIINAITGEVKTDSIIEVDSTFEIMQANHACMSEVFPDCFVNFSADNGNFIYGQPRNMVKDEIAYEEGRITWEEYYGKWYKGSLSGCNEDGISDEEAKRQIEMLREEEFNALDSICH